MLDPRKENMLRTAIHISSPFPLTTPLDLRDFYMMLVLDFFLIINHIFIFIFEGFCFGAIPVLRAYHWLCAQGSILIGLRKP